MTDGLLSDLFAILSWAGAQPRPAHIETLCIRARERLLEEAKVSRPLHDGRTRFTAVKEEMEADARVKP